MILPEAGRRRKQRSGRALVFSLFALCGLTVLPPPAQAQDELTRTAAAAVVRGADDWLFHRSEFANLCHSKIAMADIVQRLERFADIVQRSGRKFAIVIGPNKSVIYPEKLGPAQPNFACADRQRAQLRSLLAAQRSFRFLDLYSALLQAKSGTLLWYPNDLHWQPRSAMIMTEALIREVDPSLWNAADVQDEPPRPHIGGLGRAIGDTAPRLYPSVKLVRPGIRLQRIDDAPSGINPRMWDHFETARAPSAPAVDGRLFMIHDSFSIPAIPWIAQFFQSSRFVTGREITAGAMRPDMIASNIAAADTIMFEIVEQALPRLTTPLSDEILSATAAALAKSR